MCRLTAEPRKARGGEMGETLAQLRITNLLTRASVEVKALVDTGCTCLTVTDAVARQLGFDPEECVTEAAWLADGNPTPVPVIRPLEIAFEDRSCESHALVLGDQCLLGFIPLETMDLIVDPKQQRLVVRHPGGPCFLLHGRRVQLLSPVRASRALE